MMVKGSGPGTALQALTGLPRMSHPLALGCWPGLAEVTGGYLQPQAQPALSRETGTVHFMSSSFLPSPTMLPQPLHP